MFNIKLTHIALAFVAASAIGSAQAQSNWESLVPQVSAHTQEAGKTRAQVKAELADAARAGLLPTNSYFNPKEIAAPSVLSRDQVKKELMASQIMNRGRNLNYYI